MRLHIITAFISALLLSLPAVAGEGHKCDKSVKVCLNEMVYKLKSSGFIGVELDHDKDSEQLKVVKVIPGSPAEAAGIQIGDELYAINGLRFNKKNNEAISKVKVPGNEVTCTIKRGGQDKSLKLTLVPMPADLMAKYVGEHMMEHAEMEKGAVAKQ